MADNGAPKPQWVTNLIVMGFISVAAMAGGNWVGRAVSRDDGQEARLVAAEKELALLKQRMDSMDALTRDSNARLIQMSGQVGVLVELQTAGNKRTR